MTGMRLAAPDRRYEQLQEAEPRAVLRWATRTVGRLCVATSFQSSGLVILHLLREMEVECPVLFLDTGFHFSETLDFRDLVADLWGLEVVSLKGDHGSPEAQEEVHGPSLYRRDPDTCCRINKVEPLQRALEGYDGWISGIRRDQSPLRAGTPIVEAQLLPSGREVLKIHPLAHWSKADVDAYVSAHGIPTHPLLERGFESIGCRPCTRPVGPGEHEREGRWDGFAKSECGIHAFGVRGGSRETEAEQ
jgi:phosphoadenosine phosphosulfate reductase